MKKIIKPKELILVLYFKLTKIIISVLQEAFRIDKWKSNYFSAQSVIITNGIDQISF